MPQDTVVGIFHSRRAAEDAVDALQENGFSEDDLSVVAKDEEGQAQEQQGAGDDPAEGAAWGGALGAGAGLLASAGALAIPGIGPVVAAGPLAATLSGAVTGGLAGGLIDWGIPEERGQQLEQRVKRGDTLVIVHGGEAQQAEETLREHDAEDVERH